MRLLVVTEKCGPEEALRDGGARLVETLRRAFGDRLAIAQFGDRADGAAAWHFRYPSATGDRFARRLARAGFVGERVRAIAAGFTHVLYVHASMQFAAPKLSSVACTFPMFLTPSYAASGETVPEAYTVAERRALASTDRVFSPSHLERRQLVEQYLVPEGRIRVVPRGVDRARLRPVVRELRGPPRLCSVGSVKPQKDTLGLVDLFAALRQRHPQATLRVIGGVQDERYAARVRRRIAAHGLEDAIHLVGFVPPDELADVLADAHLHLSASTCETFGRGIFETLASGLPNVARATGNAAAELLAHVPYARFHDDADERLDAIDALLADLPRWSALAAEVGGLFDDALLADLLAAELADAEILGVADWDGTLFHKDDATKTARCIASFRRFPVRVLCTARGVADAVAALDEHDLGVDWIVAHSGAVVADGRGRTLWRVPVGEPRSGARAVVADGEVVQLAGPALSLAGLRVESYQGASFGARWEASKLRAVVRLLGHVGWRGRVRAFGDGPYDEELLAYFDGTRIGATAAGCLTRQASEVQHV